MPEVPRGGLAACAIKRARDGITTWRAIPLGRDGGEECSAPDPGL